MIVAVNKFADKMFTKSFACNAQTSNARNVSLSQKAFASGGTSIMATSSAYDATAPSFDRHRALPAGVVEGIRDAVLGATGLSRPRILDLGAGTGRIGGAYRILVVADHLHLCDLRHVVRTSCGNREQQRSSGECRPSKAASGSGGGLE